MSKTNYKTEYKYNRETLSSVPSTEQEETKYDKEVKTTKSEVGLADYEEQHNSRQKEMLIERVKIIIAEKSVLAEKGEKLSSIRQLQLEVAERLLGPQAMQSESLVEKAGRAPRVKSEHEIQAINQRRQNKLHYINSESGGGYSPKSVNEINQELGIKDSNLVYGRVENAAGEGFVINSTNNPEQAEQNIEKDSQNEFNTLRAENSEIARLTKYIGENKVHVQNNEKEIDRIQKLIVDKKIGRDILNNGDGFMNRNKAKNDAARSKLDSEISQLVDQKNNMLDTKKSNEARITKFEGEIKAEERMIEVAVKVKKSIVTLKERPSNYEVIQLIYKEGGSTEQISKIEDIVYKKKNDQTPYSELSNSGFDVNDFKAKKAFESAANN